MKTLITFSLALFLAAMTPVCIAEEWWSEGNPITTGLVGMSAETVNGKIYMFGGMFPPVPYYVTTVESYDPETDLWSLMTPMPEDRMIVSLATVGDSIYVFGGIGGGYVKSTVWKYTPSLEGTPEGPWQTKNPIGYPVSSGTEICALRGVTVSGGKVYIFGGYYATDVIPYVYANWHPYSTIWCYDPADDTWEPKTNLPVAGYYHATTHGEKIYLLRDDPGTDIFWEYDPSTDTLTTTGLPFFNGGDAIYGASVATISDTIYVVGGYNYPSTQATTWKYSFAAPEQGWVQLVDMPYPANSSAKATYQGNLYLFGGYSTSDGGPSPVNFTQILHITMSVVIDIKPGSYPNAINLGSQGLVPVAILSNEEFDATTVDPDTVELAGAGVAVRGKSNKFMAHEEDVNGDELLDLVVQVATANLDPGSFQDGYAVLTGKTYDGQAIEGADEITIVPPEQ